EFERSFAGALNHGTFRHRIGKRYAEFDHVGAARHQCMHQWHRQFGCRVTSGYEGNQTFVILRRERGQRGLDSGHYAMSFFIHSATVCISLSPRPDRFTKIILSLPSVAANLAAYASA